MYLHQILNTVDPSFVDNQVRAAIERRAIGRRQEQPGLAVQPSLQALLDSRLFPNGYSRFLGRMMRQ